MAGFEEIQDNYRELQGTVERQGQAVQGIMEKLDRLLTLGGPAAHVNNEELPPVGTTAPTNVGVKDLPPPPLAPTLPKQGLPQEEIMPQDKGLWYDEEQYRGFGQSQAVDQNLGQQLQAKLDK